MSAPGEPCVRCSTSLIDEGDTVRCTKCGFQANKGGSIIDIGGRIKMRTLTCPMCGGHASADQFEEFKPKKEKVDPIEAYEARHGKYLGVKER